MKDMNVAKKGRLLSALAHLAHDISEKRNSFDRDLRLPDSVVAALAEAGLFRLWLPAELGGSGLTPSDFLEVVEAAAALDGSVGWLVGNGGGMARAGGYLPASTARTIFADPGAFIVSATGATGRAVPVPGGYRVTGHWPFGSGAHHGSYFAAVCEIDEGRPAGEGRRMLAYMPRGAVTVLDTWHVSGLRATGSCDFLVENLEVPIDFTHDFQPVATQVGTLYRLPAISAFVWTVATVPLGIAMGARAAFLATSAGRTRFATTTPLALRESVQAELGRIEARLGAARTYLRATMDDVWAETEGGAASDAARVRLRSACALAGETAVEAVGKYCEMAGAGAIFESGVLERCDRDVRAAVKHVAMSPANYITQGMAALGLDLAGLRY